VLYTFGIHIYTLLLRLAALHNRKARLMMHGRRDTLRRVQTVRKPGERWVWVHAASLGEFEQGRPLMERIRREHPEVKIALTFYSPSGYEVRKNYDGADLVAYLPADTPGAMRHLIDALHPELAVVVKYEFWRNMLRELHRRHVPTLLISAIFRPHQLFFRSYGGWYRRILGYFSHIFVQDEQSARLLAGIGVGRVTVAGDTRFDRVTSIMQSTREIPELEAFTRGSHLCVMFGSSWGADEQVYFPWLRSRRGAVRAVIAPHEFDDRRLHTMRTQLSPLRVSLLSEVRAGKGRAEDADLLIIDCFGLLSSAYRYCDIAYVGGGFGTGIHNINEAAVYGVPVVFGPHHSKFLEAREMIAAGGGFSIDSRESFEALLNGSDNATGLMDSDMRRRAGAAAASYIKSKLGATDRIYATLTL